MTPTQAAVLAYLRDYFRENGCAPTLQQISNQMGSKSPSASRKHLAALESLGHIRRKHGAWRGIVLLTAAGYPPPYPPVSPSIGRQNMAGWPGCDDMLNHGPITMVEPVPWWRKLLEWIR